MSSLAVEYKPIIDILEDILGDCRMHNDYKGQLAFDCPVCSYEIKGLDHGDGKGNLEINYKMLVYKCWSCSEMYNTHGSVYKLIKKYGNEKHLKRYELLKPDEVELAVKQYKQVELPKEFIPLNNVSEGVKDIQKETIIFNESLIDWSKKIYLVEGAFDSIFLDNSIPMLGKYISDLLFNKIYDLRCELTIVLDGDAWDDAEKLYHRLNCGKLLGRVNIVKLPKDKDIADLQGNLEVYQEFKLD